MADNENVPKIVTPARLFAERVAAYWSAIWRSWRTVLDWAAALYILVPGAFLSVGMYRDFMRNPPPGMESWPLYPILAVLALIQLTGKFRTFAEPGDGLFLHRLPRWRRSFVAWGLAYGACVKLLLTSLIVAVLSPALVPVFGLTVAELAATAIYCAAAGTCWLLARDLLSHRWRGWKQALLLALAGLVFFAATLKLATLGEQNAARTVAFGAGYGAAALALLVARLRAKGTLLREISVESEAYVSAVSLVLMDALEKKPIPARRKPFLFARSRPLFRHRNADSDRVADVWAKSALRRQDFWKQIASFLGAGSAAIWLSPVALAAAVWLAMPFLAMASFRQQWRQWLAEPYPALFRWSAEVAERASRLAIGRLALPIVGVWSVLLGLKAGLAFGGFAWAAVAAVPAIGYFWARVASELFAAFGAARSDRRKENGAAAGGEE